MRIDRAMRFLVECKKYDMRGRKIGLVLLFAVVAGAALADVADRFLANGQTVVLEAAGNEDAATWDARILAYDDVKRFPQLKRIILLGRDKAIDSVRTYAAREKWPAFKDRYPRYRIDYALVGMEAGDMPCPQCQKRETRSHVFARRNEDGLMRIFIEGAPFDPKNPLCRFWTDPSMSPAEVVDALSLPEWVDREIDATKARIAAWKGNDEIVLVPTISDFHLYAPSCGVWPCLQFVVSSNLAHIKYFRHVIERLAADAAVNLGDLGIDYCSRHWSLALDNERAARLAIEDAVYASLQVPLAMVPGNHDGGWDSPSGFGDRFNSPTLPRARLLRLGETKDYGYLDLKAKRTRLFFISTSQVGNGGGCAIRADQVQFMRKAVAATPDGWAVAFFSHDCLHPDCGRWESPDYRTPSHKLTPGYVAMRQLVSETVRGGRLKSQGIICGDSHYDLDWTDPESGVRYLITQGYGGCGKARHPKYPAVPVELSFDRSRQMLIDVLAIKPLTGEWRIFRVGVGGASRDR